MVIRITEVQNPRQVRMWIVGRELTTGKAWVSAYKKGAQPPSFQPIKGCSTSRKVSEHKNI